MQVIHWLQDNKRPVIMAVSLVLALAVGLILGFFLNAWAAGEEEMLEKPATNKMITPPSPFQTTRKMIQKNIQNVLCCHMTGSPPISSISTFSEPFTGLSIVLKISEMTAMETTTGKYQTVLKKAAIFVGLLNRYPSRNPSPKLKTRVTAPNKNLLSRIRK